MKEEEEEAHTTNDLTQQNYFHILDSHVNYSMQLGFIEMQFEWFVVARSIDDIVF